ncbi:soluble lytic murein transglycosylase-like protein [Ancylobacter sp. 3268]|uniref:transglycosylase SLT domain-containing protein n=1 Tax=Ancylobacter sp. 3268 TaxID=2817752 RepID=UPI0028581281|nr:transglycosylase SLT domain-containing protein [Ancylobacter sp. 3268]MDR6952509.1 soluble lytic murein transglycosylase-like protein [Ancylobacter sp. 3268]
MNPLILLAGNLLPSLLDFLVGDRGEKVADAVVNAVAKTTGSVDAIAAQEKVDQDPAAAAELRLALARIVADEKKLALDAETQRRRDEIAEEAQARKDALDRDLASHKARLDELVATEKAALDQRQQDLAETTGARQLLSSLVDKDTIVARTPMVISYIVTIGFFLVLALFLLLKNRLEAPPPFTFPEGSSDIIRTLEPAQIAALVQPRSDFVIQIINICVGALAAAFATVMSFWLGSSQSSRNKDVLAASLQERNAESQERQAQQNRRTVEQVAKTVSQAKSAAVVVDEDGAVASVATGGPAGAPAGAVVVATPAGEPAPEPAKPMSASVLAELMPKLVHPHRHFPDGVSWALTPIGIAIDGARAEGTPGDPTTVSTIWDRFGPSCAASAKKYGVPVELIVATIATESSGNPNARRAEPQINDESVGLMQTLVGTARDATGRTGLRADDLLDPALSIDAGTAYIAKQRSSTQLDPPRVSAAYNAGSLKRDDAAANRWKLHCFPRGTGQHIDRFVAWFNDAMRVSGDEDWGKVGDCPSFALELVGTAAPPAALDVSSPDFPPRPAFRPLLSLEERQKLFGAFQFQHAPVAGNPENVRILGEWEAKNIVKVEIPLQSFRGKPGPLTMRFHVRAREQLVALWLEWEKAGLIDRVLTYDGAFVARFQRKSPTKLSNHAFGTAFDINAAWNPLGVEPAAIGEKGCVRELVPLANQHGFYWGGHFNTRPDGMHFEVAQLL